MGKLTKQEQASRKFLWIEAVRLAIAAEARSGNRHKGLTWTDLGTAASLIRWADAEMRFFRAYKDIAADCAFSTNTAEASMRRLRDAGFLIVLDAKKPVSGRSGGRPATSYAIVLPASSTRKDGGNQASVSPSRVGETESGDHEVSPSPLGEVSPSPLGGLSPSPLGTISMEEPLDKPKLSQTVSDCESYEKVVRFEPKASSRYVGGIAPRFKSVIDEFNHVWAKWPWHERDLTETSEEDRLNGVTAQDLLAITRATYCNARKVASFEQITQGIDRYVAECERSMLDDEFVMRLRNWLDPEGERWADEYGETPPEDGEPDFLSKAGAAAMEGWT